MRKATASITKEALLLWRDKGGLAMLFIMPLALILIMTLLQDSTFKELEEKNIPILLINHDEGNFGKTLSNNLDSVHFFDIYKALDKKPLTDDYLKQQIAGGHFQVGIIIKKNATEKVINRLLFNIKQQLGKEEWNSLYGTGRITVDSTPDVEIYFDPAIKNSFKLSVATALRQISSGVEAKMMFDIYSRILENSVGITMKKPEKQLQPVTIKQQYATTLNSDQIPNSVQHNVPAWTIFAMFFIVIPLSGNMIGERNGGIVKRLATIPGALILSDIAKMLVYFTIGIIQALLMIAMGIFILPLFGLPQLTLGNHPAALMVLIMAVSLAASSYGLLIGAFFTSRDQSAIFGSISVVILAAIGGIWVPVFMMSDTLRLISRLSPLNWGLNGFYDIFLRNADIEKISAYLFYLSLFSFVCILLSVWKLSVLRKD